MDQLDQIHVVSDLHLGGAPGHQICNQGAALAALIDHLAVVAPERRVGLVLNGDIVDFLAVEGALHFDPRGAVAKLQTIFEDEAFAPVWSALARFVAAPGRLLVLVLGNHDVELALPHVRAHLLARITGASSAARGRVRLAMDGTGFACMVGGRRVLCVHGNDWDPWNVIDHGAVRDTVRALNQSLAPPAWSANAGTRLVIDVVNAIKQAFPFVDLLKPQALTVPSVLLALPDRFHAPLLEFAKLSLRYARDKARLHGFLGGGEVPEDGYRALALLVQSGVEAGAKPARPEPRGAKATAEGLAWLEGARRDFSAGLRPAEVVEGDELLGILALTRDRLVGRDAREDLRQSLAEYLRGDRSFHVDTEDDMFRALDADVGPEVSFVVAGHTHLARRIPRTRGDGVYFNSGTWIRLLRIPDAALTSPEAFAPVYRALTSGRLADLDGAGDLVVQPRTLVSIWTDGAEVHGELRRASAAGDGAAHPWEVVAGTRFTLTSVER